MSNLLVEFLRMFIFVLVYFVAFPIMLFFTGVAVLLVFGWAFAIAPLLGLIVGVAEVAIILLVFKEYVIYKSYNR